MRGRLRRPTGTPGGYLICDGRLLFPRKGPAHYELRNSPFGVPGTWKGEIDVRVSKFDQYTASTEFEVRDD